MHSRFLVDVQGLHEVDFHGSRSVAQAQNGFVDILLLALEIAHLLNAEDGTPQVHQAVFVRCSDSNLLNTQDTERARANALRKTLLLRRAQRGDGLRAPHVLRANGS